MVGERDVLAEAIEKVAVLPKWDKRTVPGGFHVKRSDVLSILDAALVTLSKSAPDRDGETEPCPTCWQPVPVPQRGDHDYGIPLLAATPPADPPR